MARYIEPSWGTDADDVVDLTLAEEAEALRISFLPEHLQGLAWESLENRFYAEPSLVEEAAADLRRRSLRQ